MIKYSEPFLLSSKGSTRATAYGFSNKSVTLDGRTHVVWLDAISKVRGRTCDRATGSWSETFEIGEGQDNHATPALSVDKEKHIRIAYGPHARGWNDGRFKYAVSERPNRIDSWTTPESTTANFGYRATYACLVHTPQGFDAIVYRGGDYPLSTIFQRERKLGGWTAARAIFGQEISPQYTNYGSTCACDAEGTLYVAAHFYNVGGDFSGPEENKKSHGMAILKSADLGETWTDLRGKPVAVPTLYGERIAIPPVGADMRVAGLAVDSKGNPWTLATSAGVESRDLLLSRWTGDGWETTDLAASLPAERAATGGVLCIDAEDRVHVAVMAAEIDAVKEAPEINAWGHPSSEVFHLMTDAAVKKVECNQVSLPDERVANWLPNISRAGVFSPAEKPVILYTRGDKGEGCTPTTETEVYCVMVEDIG